MENTYHAYMLRVWTVGEGKDTIWRVSLEETSGTHRTFASLEMLTAFLQETVGSQSWPSEPTHSHTPPPHGGAGDVASA
jgi:hypothetical protein